MKRIAMALGLLMATTTPAWADVQITQDIPFVDYEINGESYFIERIQDTENVLTGDFAKTSRACPPFCIQPMEVAPGVTTVGELEVISFLEDSAAAGTGILIDARTEKWYKDGTIPGSMNIPFKAFEAEDKAALNATLESVGVTVNSDGSYDFSTAKDLMLFCNGMWCGQSPRAIRNLLKLGFPAEKLFYYRGGMQDWRILGLSVLVPGQEQ